VPTAYLAALGSLALGGALAVRALGHRARS
jgi:hypothetical protein